MKRRWSEPHPPLRMERLASMPRVVNRGMETYHVQHLSSARKDYLCPGCNHQVKSGSPHVVVWREEGPFGLDIGVDSRRHWHRACWSRQGHL